MKTKNLLAITCCIGLLACKVSNSETKDITYSDPYPLNPPTYVCYQAPGTITVDGILSPKEWEAVPWTSDFIAIEGGVRLAPYYHTRAKMTHDSQGMYFAVLVEEPHVWGTITEHDAVIYHDNDFEIFLNPANDTHNYLEYEVNALGTYWDLYLSKPYRDNPVVLNNWEFAGIQSAVHVDGTINNPNDTDKSWSVEVFIPWSSIYQVMRREEKPNEGEQIRVNFSRVQWTTEIQDGKYVKIPMPGEDKIREHNWVWAPTGVINIHLPEYWGYVQFTDKIAGAETVPFTPQPEEEIKWILRNLYYRQAEYKRTTGEYASNSRVLKPEELGSPELMRDLTLTTFSSQYEISLPDKNGKRWKIKEDGLVW